MVSISDKLFLHFWPNYDDEDLEHDGEHDDDGEHDVGDGDDGEHDGDGKDREHDDGDDENGEKGEIWKKCRMCHDCSV